MSESSIESRDVVSSCVIPVSQMNTPKVNFKSKPSRTFEAFLDVFYPSPLAPQVVIPAVILFVVPHARDYLDKIACTLTVEPYQYVHLHNSFTI